MRPFRFLASSKKTVKRFSQTLQRSQSKTQDSSLKNNNMKTLAFFTAISLFVALIGNLELRDWEADQKIKLENRQNIFDKLSEKL